MPLEELQYSPKGNHTKNTLKRQEDVSRRVIR
jgi:hypothetical protein